VIDPTAYVAPSAILLGAVTLKAQASVWDLAVLRADIDEIIVGERSNIQDGVIAHADHRLPVVLESQVGVGHAAVLHGCYVEHDCLVGIGAMLLSGVRVGSGSVIGAGAVLPEGMQVPPGSLVFGVPARVVRPVDEILTRRIESTWKDYLELTRKHREAGHPPSSNA
jgi:carbonic anhydrase/acetyltransferase-like protein (isoleucine patch superfamily)